MTAEDKGSIELTSAPKTGKNLPGLDCFGMVKRSYLLASAAERNDSTKDLVDRPHVASSFATL